MLSDSWIILCLKTKLALGPCWCLEHKPVPSHTFALGLGRPEFQPQKWSTSQREPFEDLSELQKSTTCESSTCWKLVSPVYFQLPSLSHLPDWVIVHCGVTWSHCGASMPLRLFMFFTKSTKKRQLHTCDQVEIRVNASNVVLHINNPTNSSNPRPSNATSPAEKLYVHLYNVTLYHCTTRRSLPRVCRSCSGQVTVVVLTLFPHTSRAADPMSSSVMRFTWPFLTWARWATEQGQIMQKKTLGLQLNIAVTVDNSVLSIYRVCVIFISVFSPKALRHSTNRGGAGQ